MTYEELVAKLQSAYGKHDASKIKDHLAIQFNVRGEADGALYLEILDGKIYVEPYEYYDRDILVTISAENLIAMAEDRLDVLDAYNNGLLTAEGDLGKALLLKEVVVKKEDEPKKTVADKVTSTVSTAKAVAKATATTVAKKTTAKRTNKGGCKSKRK